MATSDVVIVGGGINGVASGHALARRGAAVTVLERGTVASGPTGQSCGVVRQHYSHELTARLALEALSTFENFDELVGGDCGFQQTGFVIAVPPDREAGLRENVMLQQRVGVDTRLLSARELQEMIPGLDTSGIALAAYEERSGYADAHATSMSYAAAARELGATIRTNTEVSELRTEGGRIVGVDTVSDGSFDADVVVLAAGPWSLELLRPCGVELPTRAHRVQVGVFESAPGSAPERVFVDTSLGIYVRPDTDSMMLVGSVDTAEADPDIDGLDTYKTAADTERMDAYIERLVQHVPAMSDGRYHSGYAALYDVSPDWLPIVDAIPGIEGLFCVVGSSGHGFKLAPAIAEMTADLVTGTSVADPLFSFERFGAGVAVTGSYPEQSILG
ncbi:MAG TPA: FAD-dependent oxidoreductase [Acidobacteriota bacterium]|nr:FAD-dependent oxidoreductase [Acidobacteriota bacterium]